MKNIFLSILITAIVCLLIGFFVGRSSITLSTKVEYKLGETIKGSVSSDQLKLIKEEKPLISLLPVNPITQNVDTAAIIAEYELKRTYSLIAFDDLYNGKLSLFPTIQYNRLTGIDYQFTPITKTITEYKIKVWQPFISASYSTLDYWGVGGGLFYYNIGLQYQYQRDFKYNRTGHLIGLLYKF